MIRAPTLGVPNAKILAFCSPNTKKKPPISDGLNAK